MTNGAQAKPAVVHLTWSLAFGGVEKHLATIARTGGRHYDHRFCALASGGDVADQIQQLGGEVEVLGTASPLPTPQSLMRVAAMLRRRQARVVHGHGLEGNLFALLAGRLAGIPVRIGEEIGIPSSSARSRILRTIAYRSGDRIIGISDAVAQWLTTTDNVPTCKVVRIYNPVELSEVSAAPRQVGEPLRIGFAGRLEEVKNPLALVEAVAGLQGQGVEAQLLLLGDGSQRHALEAARRAAPEPDRIQLLGYVRDPLPILAGCHLYVQPSLSEGFGIALVEAMSCGLPVIATSIGGMPEIVQHGRTGWLIDNSGKDAIAEAIRAAAALPREHLSEMGMRARASVQTRFSPPAYIEQLEALYDIIWADKGA
jgi:glycosyltransferase involved in cell wall biosynthesis